MSYQPNPFTSLTRHDVYYINGGDLYFLVQTVTFRVHRYFFERESPRFKGLLSQPASPGAQRQGTSDSNAIVLDNVAPSEFAKFLWVFYNPRYSLYDASPEDWTTVLDLAWRWQFGEVKALAVRELEKLIMLDVDRISVYHSFDVDRNLLIPRYAALCAREDPLSLEEGMKLGLETALMIARTREHARANPTKGGARSPSASSVSETEMETLVRQLFGIKPSENGGSGLPPIGASPVTPQSTSFTAAGQAVANGGKTSPKPTPPAKTNGASKPNGPNDANSLPRPQSPQHGTGSPPLININTGNLIDSTTEATNPAPAGNDGGATAPPAQGQTTTSTTEGRPNPGDSGEGKPEQPKGEASAIGKTNAANDEPQSRADSPTRGNWNKRGGSGPKTKK